MDEARASLNRLGRPMQLRWRGFDILGSPWAAWSCAASTEDYRHWLVPLAAKMDRVGQVHDFVLAQKAGQMWKTNTMAKARHILAAMEPAPERG